MADLSKRDQQAERLRQARIAARYESAKQFADSIGVPEPTYIHHENGTRGFTRRAETYARRLRVSLDWLMTGRGEMTLRVPRVQTSIPVDGIVGAGEGVQMIDDPAGSGLIDEIYLPNDGSLGALVVRGESQWPRFMDGETVLYDRTPVSPASMIGRMAIVQTLDGRRLIKTLQRSRAGDNRWRLDSHNAPPEDDVQLLGVWRYIGTLAQR